MGERTVGDIYGSGSVGTTWKGTDLVDGDYELVISGAEEKLMDQKNFETGEKYKAEKIILSFAGDDRKLILNATNARAIEAGYGRFYSQWIGKTIVLYEGEWKGDPVVRVRVPKAVKKAAPAKPSENPADGLDDEIPF